MEINGIPFTNDEDLKVIRNDLATKRDIHCHNPIDVGACHHIPFEARRSCPFMVQFSFVLVVERWMGTRKKLATLGRSGNQQKIYFNENLTRTNKNLSRQARTMGRAKSYKFVWVKNSTIFAKKDENSPPVRIASAWDLERII